ncbi:MAG TPA: IclR family transcriptional regulator [Cytophagales bacterium]|nr:IclR family transcriptional regulator [Cytophagales bacterium]HAA24317.1 IclR family transcriptional regulator [Cytophagales bacterium]HAP63974.1 IclR family transcriptional regulator [Cytophagales bacterium]
METLLHEIRKCTICSPYLEHGVRPVVQAHPNSRLLIIGQAPGRRVHTSGIPFDDPSGERLRRWLGITRDTFYDARQVAIMPMGFCFPGTGKSGDLPPRPECAPQWHRSVLGQLNNVQLTLLIGQYAQKHYLQKKMAANLTETVKKSFDYLPYLPLVHPSPRNVAWHKKNPWFEAEVVPGLQSHIEKILNK